MSQIFSKWTRVPVGQKPVSGSVAGNHTLCDRWFLALFVSLASVLFPVLAAAQSLAAPTSLVAATYSKTQINLSWNDPSQGESGYVVERAKGSATGFAPVYSSASNVTTWSDAQLAPGITYFFRVRAFSVAGGVTSYSAYSAISSALTLTAAFPDEPTNLIAAAFDSTQIKLSWQNKATNASGYRVQQLNPANNAWSVVGTTTSTKNYYQVGGLTPLSTNTFRVVAWNTAGDSAPSNTVAASTKSDTQAPTGTVVINGGAAYTASPVVNLNLSANDPSGVTGYYVSGSSAAPASGGAGWVAVTTTTSYSATVPYTLSAGDGSKAVYAFFKDIAGNVSIAASSSINLDQTAPVGGTLTSGASGSQINLSWAGFSDSGSGMNAASYKLVFSTSGSPAANCTTGTVLATGAVSTFAHTGLSVGTTYYYRACASDTVGNIAAGATATGVVTPVGTMPTGTIVINGDAPATKIVTVTATLNATAAGGITGYRISLSASTPTLASSGWVAVASTPAYSANVPYTPAFSADGPMTIYAWFKDAAGNISATSSDSYVLDRTAPTNGTVTANGVLGQVTLSWNGFSDGTGSGIESYKLAHSTSATPANCASGTVLYSGLSTTFVQLGLGGGAANYYRVCAIDAAGNESSGAIATATALGNAPPVARAGPDQTGSAASPIYFDASGSTDTDGNIVSYNFTFGDGLSFTSANAAVVTHLYSLPGTYTMTLAVTDNLGATTTDTAVVTVVAPAVSLGTFSSVKQLGGSSSEVGYAVAVDRFGNSVIAGTFQGTANFGGGTLTSAGVNDIFIAKFSATGAHVCSLAIGGAGDDRAYSVAVDSSGNIFVAGVFAGTVNFGGTTLVSEAGSLDGFVAKYSPSCATTALWARRMGSAVEDAGYGVAVDKSGDVVVTGFVTGGSDLGGGFTSGGGLSDLFVAKYAGGNGAYSWARIVRGVSADMGRAIAVDVDNNIVLGGGFRLSISDDTHPNMLTSAGNLDAFVIKYSPAGSILWARSAGGTGDDMVYGLAVDVGGNIVVTGSFQATMSIGGTSLVASGASDGFIAKFSPMGSYLWSSRIGGAEADMALAVATDAIGNIVMAGSTEIGGQWDTYIRKYSSSGAVLWAKTFASPDHDVGYGIATDASNNVFVSGYFRGTTNFGGGAVTSAGVEDVFLLKLAP